MSFESKNWLNLWLLGALGLCGFYAYVLQIARHPDVSEAYRAYYIDRSTDLPVWQAEGWPGDLPALQPGRVYPHTAPEIALAGWSDPEPGHVWTLGHEAVLFAALPADLAQERDYELVLRGSYLGGAQTIKATFAGQQSLRTWHEGEDIVLPLPPAARDEALLSVRLDLPEARAPGTADSRILAFALKELLLREAAE